jgi:hypothetical protein
VFDIGKWLSFSSSAVSLVGQMWSDCLTARGLECWLVPLAQDPACESLELPSYVVGCGFRGFGYLTYRSMDDQRTPIKNFRYVLSA